jgi:uncharacterized protein (TIGR00255 family)
LTLVSMTGFGRAQGRQGGLTAEAEVRSVNGRYLQVRCRLPGDLMRLEPRLEALVRGSVVRGSVDVHVRFGARGRGGAPRIDRKVLRVYREAFDSLGGGEPALLLSLPGVISTSDPEPSEAAIDRVVLQAVRKALAAMVATRAKEGRRLGTALRREALALSRHLAALRRRAPAAVRQHQAQIQRRLAALLGESPLPGDDPLLRREVAFLADRSDITEELDRLESHVESVRESFGSSRPVGRHLDFLLQEIGREINTVGSKCSDAAMAERVVQAKGTVERLREQAANIE